MCTRKIHNSSNCFDGVYWKKNEREIAEIARRYRTIRGVSCVEGLQIHVSKFERQKSHKVDTTLGGRGSTSQKTRGSRAFVISHLVR